MSQQVIFTLCLKISPSNLATLLSAVRNLVEDTAKEEGALSYEYQVSEDETTISIYERYVDAESAILPITNTFPPYAEIFASLTRTEYFFIQGGITDQLKQTMESAQPTYLKPFSGFDRH